jgi:methylation protein EvaC
MKNCRICNEDIKPFMSFGSMPIANGFLAKEEFSSEYFYEMEVAFCNSCGGFQLVNQPDARKMFHENYAFFSSLSRHMQDHFKSYADYVKNTFLSRRINPFVVELGSNDGIMLQHFRSAGIKHLGIEPSANVAEVARSKGIDTLSEFFSFDLANNLLKKYGQADVVICANVMCHIPDINNVASGMNVLLKPDGVLIFEDPYLGDMVAKISYDQIYDEHVFIFSGISVSSAFGRHGLELIDVLPQLTHGGSMRYVLAHKGAYPVSPRVHKLIENEQLQGLDKAETFEQFKLNCETSRMQLKQLLEGINTSGGKVIGYGATSKSTTILNYCSIGPELIEFISDTTPIKQGKFSPGAHIPVRSYEEFTKDPPEYALLFAWNHSAEIFEKERNFKENGGKWIIFVPKVQVL